jgi:phosphodiesterase/alkaline phosphatase D-like protein
MCFDCQDAWDGYRANRMRVLEHLYSEGINNTVILAGDSHVRLTYFSRPLSFILTTSNQANWVSDLARASLFFLLICFYLCLNKSCGRSQ